MEQTSNEWAHAKKRLEYMLKISQFMNLVDVIVNANEGAGGLI